jgi:hypothetical protein
MTSFGEPGFIQEVIKDLSWILQLLKKNFPNVKITEGMELICGKKYNLEKATSTCWASDMIYPTGHTNAKMALHLLKAVSETTNR